MFGWLHVMLGSVRRPIEATLTQQLLVATGVCWALSVTVGAKETQVGVTIVKVVAVDVIDLKYKSAPEPFADVSAQDADVWAAGADKCSP